MLMLISDYLCVIQSFRDVIYINVLKIFLLINYRKEGDKFVYNTL